MLNVFYGLAATEEDGADAAERLRERGDDERDLSFDARLFEDAVAVRAERAGAVRVVEDDERVVRGADVDHLLDGRLVAVERVDAFEEDDGVLPLARLQDALEALHRVV